MKKIRTLCCMLLLVILAGVTLVSVGCTNGMEAKIYEVDSAEKLSEILTMEDTTINIKLTQSFNADVVIEKGKDVVIDLNGNKLTNSTSNTITNKGTLRIRDTSSEELGIVDNVTNSKAPIHNTIDANLTIESGNFTRSQEAGTVTAGPNGNSYYVVDNQGTLTISGGNFNANGTYSSLVRNGYYYYNDNTTEKNARLTISGGNFRGGKYAVNNSPWGIGNINGGTFVGISGASSCIFNESTLNITDCKCVAENCRSVIFNWSDEGNPPANTTISGGSMEGSVTTSIYRNQSTGTITGTLTGTVTEPQS